MRKSLTRWLLKPCHKLNEWINAALGGTHHHFSCFLPAKLGSIAALILRLFYSGVKLEESQTAIIEQIEKDAIIVYATKFTNYFEFMFYYRRYQKLGLPFPQIGFEYRLLIWQPVSRLLKILLAHVDYFLRNFKFPDAYKSGYIKGELIDGRCGYLSMVGKKVFYRRFVEARKDPIQYLIETQQSIDRPIYIVPQLMCFTKKPHRTHSTLIDVLFGPEDKPGKIRRVITLFKNPGNVFVEISEPINLKQYLESEDNQTKSTEYQSLVLRRDLLVQLNRHRQSITGPIVKTREELKESILTSERFQSFVNEYSQNRNMPIQQVRKKADAYIEEIAANYSPAVLNFYSAIVGWILNTMFDGVIINRDGLYKVKTISQKAPLILIPCHKSHIDYLILSYLLYHNNMPCPLIAAGQNLSFWPLGPLFRSGGAFFIRRSFKGAVLYSRVFAEYIHMLLEEGFNVEQFIEGGRSRTGKLLMPKLGLLSILLNAYKNGACNDMIFVPIYIGYDRVLEESSYLHELEGGQKEPENFRQVIQARKFLKKRYGKIYIQFHDPISLSDLLTRQEKSLTQMTSTELNALCRNLGHRMLHAISRSTVVTPHGLAASAILNCGADNFSSDALISIIEAYLRYLATQDAKLSDTLVYDSYHAIQRALDAFVQRKFIEPLSTEKQKHSSEATYLVNENKRPYLEYYKNNCIGFFIPAAFTALAILEKDAFQFSASDLYASYTFLQDFFKFEFSYDADQCIEDYVHNSINAFVDDAILSIQPTQPDTYNLSPSGLRKLKRFSIFLKTYFESYWVVLTYFRQTPQNTIKSKERLKKIEDSGIQMYKRKEIERNEALNKVSYQNAVDFFISRGVKGAENSDKLKSYAEAITRSLNHLRK
ncbi:MAG: 1-acyl-sn-glycerol-3-phosphate acyltransferase [Desulfobacterales bacterium]|jgi:glycerol-3-phosphate O-acyltransferase